MAPLLTLLPSLRATVAEAARALRSAASDALRRLLVAHRAAGVAAPIVLGAVWVWAAGAVCVTYGVELVASRALGRALDLWLPRATLLVSAGGLSVTLIPLCLALYLLLVHLQRATEGTVVGRGIQRLLDQEATSAAVRGVALASRASGGAQPKGEAKVKR